MKYIVDVKEASYATVQVEADTMEDAEMLIEEMYCEGRIDWKESYLETDGRGME